MSTSQQGEDPPGHEPNPLIVAWYQRAHVVLAAHHVAAGHFDRLHYWLGIPAVIVSAVVGTTVFATLQSNPHVAIQILVGLGSVLAAVLTSLQTFLRYSERAEKHRVAGVRYGALMRELEQALILCPHESELKAFLNDVRIRWDRLNEETPTMPQKIWRQVNGQPERAAVSAG